MQLSEYARYAIYWTPPPGPLGRFGAQWLGWDPAASREVEQPDIGGLPVQALTDRPRRYGLHATIKAPFRLADGKLAEDLSTALDTLAARLPPVLLNGLVLARMGGFLCLRPEGDIGPVTALAAETVRALDHFRAPMTEAEIAQRRRSRLSPDADALMLRWGYPNVMERFQFHITLTGRLNDAVSATAETALWPVLRPLLPRPFRIDALTLMGEDEGGRFHVLHRAALSGTAPG